MSIDVATEKRFEQDIETFMLSKEGGYTKTTDTYDVNYGLINALYKKESRLGIPAQQI